LSPQGTYPAEQNFTSRNLSRQKSDVLKRFGADGAYLLSLARQHAPKPAGPLWSAMTMATLRYRLP
jgi:hypothetical protein